MLKNFLSVLFNSGEQVCVSNSQYAYMSIPVEELYNESVTLVSANPDIKPRSVSVRNLNLIALNPIVGNREDVNCVAFRSFLVEMDGMDLKDQYSYIKEMRMPYSACVFSGGKSLHFAITLSEDLGTLDTYRYLSSWILNVMKKADQSTKNPSRCIRIAGGIRDGKEQKLVELKARVSLEELNAWLSQFEHLRPPPPMQYRAPESKVGLDTLPMWVSEALRDGVSAYAVAKGDGRNQRWFKIFCEFAKRGYTSEESMGILDHYFEEESDFGRREWETIAKSAEKFKVG